MTFAIDRPRATDVIVDEKGRPNRAFGEILNKAFSQIEGQINSILEVQAAAAAAQTAADAAQTAADAADVAATAAQASAASATTDAAAAQSAADGANAVAALTNSGVSGLTLTATDAGADATISVSAHTRHYGDGSTLAILGPVNLTGRAYSTEYFIYYDDPTRLDATPAYQTTTSEATAAQTGDRHLVGKITTPAALGAPATGNPVLPPGVGSIEP